MPVNPLRPICCREVGCGYVYKHKRMEGKAWKLERMVHVASGDCATRVTAFQEKQKAVVGFEVALAKAMETLQVQIDVNRIEHQHLKERVERRLESRFRKKNYIERDSKPKPWPMARCVPYLLEQDVGIRAKFKEIMTADRDPAWSWERALGAWFHWLLDQSPSDPVLMLYGGEIRFWSDANSKTKTTRLRYFRCMAHTVKDWDHADESMDSFFVGFYFPMIAACRDLNHWTNRIMFDLPCNERDKDEFDRKVFPTTPYMMEPDLQFHIRIASVFHDVLAQRMEKRKESD